MSTLDRLSPSASPNGGGVTADDRLSATKRNGRAAETVTANDRLSARARNGRADRPPILLIDNYDSFTWNLVHRLAELGVSSEVVRNDALSAEEALARRPQAVILSPGPCAPDQAGICLELLARAPDNLPILGVCLGHQAIGQAFGGAVVRAKTLMHGKTSPIRHDGASVFAGVEDGFTATRYHSLAVERATLPEALEVTAWTEDGEVMGLAHRDRPIHGVQFHPESIATEAGHDLLANFLSLAALPLCRDFQPRRQAQA